MSIPQEKLNSLTQPTRCVGWVETHRGYKASSDLRITIFSCMIIVIIQCLAPR